ncbi:hypothetical protein D9X91_04040 [Falsibacillus albus]|uniref:Uncharacterized protein n=1 Tax=Falsibacillus albus TaxID=2478915 RepID=A0A3L7K2K2_9BACI|nr:hypothetical protein D9X91_04040 [Falsibacillus albus]
MAQDKENFGPTLRTKKTPGIFRGSAVLNPNPPIPTPLRDYDVHSINCWKQAKTTICFEHGFLYEKSSF